MGATGPILSRRSAFDREPRVSLLTLQSLEFDYAGHTVLDDQLPGGCEQAAA